MAKIYKNMVLRKHQFDSVYQLMVKHSRFLAEKRINMATLFRSKIMFSFIHS